MQQNIPVRSCPAQTSLYYANEVFHIEQILGCLDYYGHEADYHHGLEDE